MKSCAACSNEAEAPQGNDQGAAQRREGGEEEMTGYQFRLETSPLDAALAELDELLARQPEACPYRLDAAKLLSVVEQCFLMIPDVRVAEGAVESVTTFQPSERLLKLLAALRARERDFESVA
jgi:hypothetical protein